MPKLKTATIIPTGQENAAIRAGIAADPDTYELGAEDFNRLRPAGRPKAAVTKDQVTIRLSPEVTAYFRESGKGWQGRLDNILKAYVAASQSTSDHVRVVEFLKEVQLLDKLTDRDRAVLKQA